MGVNLFRFATKELSQDAFLLWLVSNADKRQNIADKSLQKVAHKFVRALIGPYDKEIEFVEVERQWNHIDVSFSVNDDFFVIIEDKAGASLHDNQLKRYRVEASERARSEGRKLKCVYYNSKNPVASEVKLVEDEKSGYDYLKRKDLLGVLDEYVGDNAILTDYREWLREIEDLSESYKTLPVSEWSCLAWQGFFEWLREKKGDREDIDWNYSPNQAGGLWWCKWHGGYIDDLDFYLQFEYHIGKGMSRLCFKAYCESDKMPKIAPALKAGIELRGFSEIEPPDRFNPNGCSCTVMCVPIESLAENGRINLSSICSKLKRYENVVDEVRDRVECALTDEEYVKNLLCDDVAKSLIDKSGFEWKTKGGDGLALEDFTECAIQYNPVKGKRPRGVTIKCVFQERLMFDCQVGGCVEDSSFCLPDDSREWLAKQARHKDGWSINEDKWWPIWRHIGTDVKRINMDKETVHRLKSDGRFRKSIVEDIALSVLDIYNLLAR